MSEAIIKIDQDKFKETQQAVKDSAKKGISFLRKVPLPVYYVLGGVALYHFGVKPIIKDFSGLFDTNPGSDEFKDNKDQILGRDTSDGTKKNILSDQEIQSIANRQLASMDRPGTGDEIFDELKALSGKDLQRVYVAFGKEWYDPFLGVKSGSLFSAIGHKEEDLFGWYNGELDSSELDQMRKIWEKSGLHFPGTTNYNALS